MATETAPIQSFPHEKLTEGDIITETRIKEFVSRLEVELKNRSKLGGTAEAIHLLNERVIHPQYKAILEPFVEYHKPITLEIFKNKAILIAQNSSKAQMESPDSNSGKFLDGMHKYQTVMQHSDSIKFFLEDQHQNLLERFLKKNEKHKDKEAIFRALLEEQKDIMVRDFLKSIFNPRDFAAFLSAMNMTRMDF